MTILLTILTAVFVGAGSGVAVFYFLGGNAHEVGYQEGLLAGQRQAVLTGATRVPAISGEAWNSPELLRPRRRSPDVKPAPARPMRPVFERAPIPR